MGEICKYFWHLRSTHLEFSMEPFVLPFSRVQAGHAIAMPAILVGTPNGSPAAIL